MQEPSVGHFQGGEGGGMLPRGVSMTALKGRSWPFST